MTYALTILGGLGVFLLGMKLLSDNLRDAAHYLEGADFDIHTEPTEPVEL